MCLESSDSFQNYDYRRSLNFCVKADTFLGKRKTHFKLFSKFQQGTGSIVRVRHSNKNVAHIPRFRQTKTEGQLDQEKNSVSCQRERQTTLADLA